MTDSYDNTLTALLREERDANRIHRAAIDRLTEENARLADENRILREKLWDAERAETEKLGTFPAPPRGKSLWIAEPCGCSQERECDKHYLDGDDKFRRAVDQ